MTASYDRIKTVTDVDSDFANRKIPAGTMGTIVERYSDPEGYAVDLAIADDSLVGGFRHENVILKRAQFEFLESDTTAKK